MDITVWQTNVRNQKVKKHPLQVGHKEENNVEKYRW
jgi:hypothetical protein